MNRALLKKAIWQSQWLLAACMSAMFAFCWLYVWIHSQFDAVRFQSLLDLVPREWERFTTVGFAWLVTYPGRIALTYSEPIVLFCVAVWAIARGSDCVSGELDRGTLELVLAQPVSRLEVLLANATVTVAGLLLIVASGWAGTAVGIHTTSVREQVTPTVRVPLLRTEIPIPWAEKKEVRVPMSEKVSPAIYVPASVNLLCLGVMLAGATTMLSACDRYRWRTVGLAVGLFVVQIILKIAGMATDKLSWLLYATLLTAYDPERMVQIAERHPEQAWQLWSDASATAVYHFGPLGYHLLLAGTGLIGYVVAAIVFSRRDLPAPL